MQKITHDAGALCGLAEDAIRHARAKGADAAESRAGESVGAEVRVRLGNLDGMETTRDFSLSVTAYVGGREGAASVGELNSEAAREAAERAVAIARASAADPCAGLAEAELMANPAEVPDLELWRPWEVSPEEMIAMAKAAEEESFAVGGKISREKGEGAGVSTECGRGAYANTHGFCASREGTTHSLWCAALAEGENEMERDDWSETNRDAAKLPAPETIGRTAGERALRRLGARKIAPQRGGVLFSPTVSHSLIGSVVAAASGGNLYRGTSWLRDMLGKEFCAEHLRIVERPLLPGELRSAGWDAEGVALREREIVSDGRLRGYFLSAYSARKLGAQTTGNAGGCHNLDVSGKGPGAKGMLAELGRGLLVTEMMGSGVSATTGDYSRGAAGFWVEDGAVAHPVSEVTVAGNLREMLRGVAAVDDADAIRRGAILCGSVLVGEMTIGGNK